MGLSPLSFEPQVSSSLYSSSERNPLPPNLQLGSVVVSRRQNVASHALGGYLKFTITAPSKNRKGMSPSTVGMDRSWIFLANTASLSIHESFVASSLNATTKAQGSKKPHSDCICMNVNKETALDGRRSSFQ